MFDFNRQLGPVLAMAMLVCAPPLCYADETRPAKATMAATPSDSGEWKFDGAVYLFAATITGESATGGNIDIGFDELVDNLDFAAMGSLYAGKNDWKVGADVIYLNVQADNDGSFTLPAGPGLSVDTKSDISLKSWIVTPSLQYLLIDNDTLKLQGVVGARFLWIDVGVKFKTATRVGSNTRIKGSDAGSVWDGIVGVKGRIKLNERWYLPYYADVGTGQSVYTWQGFAGVAYRFSKLDAVLGYRYAAWKFDHGLALDDLQLSGPMLGAKFSF